MENDVEGGGRPIESPASHATAPPRVDGNAHLTSPRAAPRRMRSERVFSWFAGMFVIAASLAVFCAGWETMQLIWGGLALLSGIAALISRPRLGARAAVISSAMFAAVGLLTFASWNLLGMPEDRWSFRVAIYGFYSAACAAAACLLSRSTAEAAITRREWTICLVLYITCSIWIAATKPWFAQRMRNDAADTERA